MLNIIFGKLINLEQKGNIKKLYTKQQLHLCCLRGFLLTFSLLKGVGCFSAFLCSSCVFVCFTVMFNLNFKLLMDIFYSVKLLTGTKTTHTTLLSVIELAIAKKSLG